MRNLKKILALVLALVMSLSLMATAGAASFPDVDDDNPYATAIEVLDELKVFQGFDDGTFKPTDTLNRAQAAVLVYRIATGDVENKYLDNYTFMQQSKFTDLDGYNWAKGYINYCQNAGIVVGTTATTFDPGAKVTGYQLLVMLLRTLGYGKAGEFTDPKGWELQTAAIAEREGILKNVTTGDFGAPAPRQMVAEILFQGLLTDTVEYSALTPNGYTKSGVTLGKREFDLEEIEGVVVANEYANLYDTSVLTDGTTNLEVAKDDIRTLDTTTDLTDMGMRQHVYIAGRKVLHMTDEGLNTVKENDGAAVDIRSAAQFRATAEMNLVTTGSDATQFYVNFGRTGNFTCDQRLEFQVTFQTAAAEASFNGYISNIIANIAASETGWTDNGVYPRTYNKVIRATEDISSDDLDVIRGIFGAADNAMNNGIPQNQITGDVFVGTVSTNSATTNEERDLSNTISYGKFVETYLNPETFDINWGVADNGEWVKFIDNDNDGNCDYAFDTVYWLDEAVGTYTNRDGDTVTEYYAFDDDDTFVPNGDATVRYLDGETPAVGDKVLVALIDNQYLVEPAQNETVIVSNYNWRDDKIVTDKGEYGQSGEPNNGVGNATEMQDLIRNMEDRIEYVVYFDHFGYVRAFELPGGTQYALLTEIYAKNNMTGNVLQNWPLTVELKVGEAEQAEYDLSGGFNNQMVGGTAWTEVQSLVGNLSYFNWLQPAIAHLGVTRTNPAGLRAVKGTPTFTGATWTLWSDWNQIAKVVTPADAAGLAEFNYGPYDRTRITAGQTTQNTYSFTNVGVVNISDNTATVNGAALLRLDNAGNITRWPDGTVRYAVDYVQLATGNVVKGQVNYPIHANYGSWANGVVNATHDTEYYIVHNDGVEYFKDYVNMPALNGDNYIYAAYAVAHDTSDDSANQPYWVADVIVYEVREWTDDSRTSVALAYFGQSRSTGEVQMVKTLSNASGGPMVDVIPTNLSWNAQGGSFNDFSGYGFYHVWNGSAVEDGQMTARRLERIQNATPADGNYGKAGIYAGVVDRVTEDAVRGGYIYVNTAANNQPMQIALAVSNNVYEIQNDNQLGGGNYNEAFELRYNNLGTSDVQPGDLIIWQGGARNANTVCSSAFIVDLGTVPANPLNPVNAAEVRYLNTPAFLTATEWAAINAEQGVGATTNNIDITFKFTSTDPDFPGKNDVTLSVPKDTAVTYQDTQAMFSIEGWDVDSMAGAYSDGTPAGAIGTWTPGTPGTFALTAAQTTENITVTVTYDVANYTLTVNTTTMGGATAQLAVNGTNQGSPYSTAEIGDTYVVTINNPAAGYSYTYTVNGGASTAVPANNQITGTVGGANVTIAITGNDDAQDAENERVDEETKVEGADPGVDPGTGVSYQSAYEAAGFTIGGTGHNATVSVDAQKLQRFIDAYNALGNNLFNTLRPDTTGTLLAAGVTFAAPSDAAGVKILNVAQGVDPETVKANVAAQAITSKNTVSRDDFDNDGVHLYIAVTNQDATPGSAAPGGTGKALDSLNPTYAARDKYTWLQFTDDNGANLGEPVLVCISLSWTNL